MFRFFAIKACSCSLRHLFVFLFTRRRVIVICVVRGLVPAARGFSFLVCSLVGVYFVFRLHTGLLWQPAPSVLVFGLHAGLLPQPAASVVFHHSLG